MLYAWIDADGLGRTRGQRPLASWNAGDIGGVVTRRELLLAAASEDGGLICLDPVHQRRDHQAGHSERGNSVAFSLDSPT